MYTVAMYTIVYICYVYSAINSGHSFYMDTVSTDTVAMDNDIVTMYTVEASLCIYLLCTQLLCIQLLWI